MSMSLYYNNNHLLCIGYHLHHYRQTDLLQYKRNNDFRLSYDICKLLLKIFKSVLLLEITDVWNVFVAIHEYCASSNNVTFFINSTPIPSSETTTYLGSVFKGCRFLYHVTVGVGVPSAMQVSDGLEP